ncbi:MAG: right-handed parallel beta-helix repeat-containing protein [Pirellulales bacterium]
MEAVEPLAELFATYTVTNNLDSGTGSFRQALINANKKNDLDTINFNIAGSKKIVFKSSVPFILYPVNIDGTSQPGYAGKPLIELSGEATSGDGIRLGGGNSTVKGLVINKFKGSGILVVNAGGDTIKGNYIGTDITGTKDYGNGGVGIVVSFGKNTIGGPAVTDRNIISGNTRLGLQFWTSKTYENTVTNNYIGTDVTGNVAVPNDGSGVVINGSPRNTFTSNLISGNKQDGLVMNPSGGSGEYNKVLNNIVGLNAAGNALTCE